MKAVEAFQPIVFRNAIGRPIQIDLIGPRHGRKIVRQHDHLFLFAGQLEAVHHSHEVQAEEPEHMHPMPKGSRFSSGTSA